MSGATTLHVLEENAKGFLAWLLLHELRGLLQTLSMLAWLVWTQSQPGQKSRRGK